MSHNVLVTHADAPIGRRVIKRLFHDEAVGHIFAAGSGPPPRAFDRFLAGGEPRMSYARLDLADLSGLWYDAEDRSLRALVDGQDLMIRMTRTGRITGASPLGVNSPEGIAFDEEGSLYIAQDPGGIVKMRLRRTR